jgi:hypothetical protein
MAAAPMAAVATLFQASVSRSLRPFCLTASIAPAARAALPKFAAADRLLPWLSSLGRRLPRRSPCRSPRRSSRLSSLRLRVSLDLSEVCLLLPLDSFGADLSESPFVSGLFGFVGLAELPGLRRSSLRTRSRPDCGS